MRDPKSKARESKTQRAAKSLTSSKPKHGAKKEFVEAHRDLKPQAVAALAKQQGLTISTGYIASQRSKMKKEGVLGAATSTGKKLASSPSLAAEGALVRALKAAIQALTMKRVREIFHMIEMYESQ